MLMVHPGSHLFSNVLNAAVAAILELIIVVLVVILFSVALYVRMVFEDCSPCAMFADMEVTHPTWRSGSYQMTNAPLVVDVVVRNQFR
jgi:hypothetical protein